MEYIYRTEITEIGPDVEEFLDGAGLMITFEDGAPPELAEISVMHKHTEQREEPPVVGDILAIGALEFEITAVGGTAWKNMLDLGHAAFKFNGAKEAGLPGEICLKEQGLEGVKEAIGPGVSLEIRTTN
ncbi:MAG: PTS glucitol/sorbitol transporter subunit IIA [Rubrobacteraceae bacterium]